MAAGQTKQFLLLVWKNWIIQKRKILCTICEICVPILLSVILVLLRLQFKVKEHDSVTSWHSFQVNELKDHLQTCIIGTKTDVDGGSSKSRDPYDYDYGFNDRNFTSKTRSLVYTPDTPWTRAVVSNAASRLGLNATGRQLSDRPDSVCFCFLFFFFEVQSSNPAFV